MFLKISPSPRKNKRFMAEFFDEEKKVMTTHFSSKNGMTFIDHGDENKRLNYIKRHFNLGTENWSDFFTAGSLSRWILWEERNLNQGIKSFAKRFGLTIKE